MEFPKEWEMDAQPENLVPLAESAIPTKMSVESYTIYLEYDQKVQFYENNHRWDSLKWAGDETAQIRWQESTENYKNLRLGIYHRILKNNIDQTK